jgi:lysophospholipase L1-like esterase
LLIAGDSSAAGVGVATQDHAFSGHFLRACHCRSNRPLRWRLRAKSGLTTKEVDELLQAEPPLAGDIALGLSGVNDVIGPIPPRRGPAPRRHNDAMLRWAATRRDVFVAPVDLQLAPGAMARDGFHPGEPVYRASGELIARFVADRLMLLKRG